MKVNIKSSISKKSFFSNKFDNNTTSHFGFVQPISCTELVPQSTVNFACNSFIRLSPLVKPTYGRVNQHSYTCFVPCEDIYHPFNSMLAGTSFNGGGNSYIPSSVPSISQNFLTLFVLLHSSCISFYVDDNGNLVRITSDPDYSYRNIFLRKFCPSVILSSTVASNFYKNYVDGVLYTTNFNVLTPAVQDNVDNISGKSDFVFVVNKDESNNIPRDIYYFFRFSDFAKNLRSIFLGLGYQIGYSTRSFSLLPLFAFYKCYFDLFFPKRFVSFEDSSLYRLIELIEFSNTTDVSKFFGSSVNKGGVFVEFIKSLARCYYTSSTDFISAHVTDTANHTNDIGVSLVSPQGSSVVINAAPKSAAEADDVDVTYRSGLRVLNFLSKYINKNSRIGQRVEKILRAQFDSDASCSESYLINSYVTPIEISDVMSTNQSSDVSLGEYAGKGIGVGYGRKTKFTAKKFGFLIHFSCIVPESGYCQGIDKNLSHLGRFDFYNDGLDGKTLVPSRKDCVLGYNDYCFDSSRASEAVFGLIPVYSEYKVKSSILNGDFTQHSTRSSLLPFSLDKIIPYSIFPSTSNNGFAVESLYDNIVAGILWRYIGRYRWLGQYDRIFYNQPTLMGATWTVDGIYTDGYQRMDDNFIIHNHLRIDMHAPMLQIADSFDTGMDDPENRGDVYSLSLE